MAVVGVVVFNVDIVIDHHENTTPPKHTQPCSRGESSFCVTLGADESKDDRKVRYD